MTVTGNGVSSEQRRAETADGSWMLWTSLGISGIWVAVVMGKLRGDATWRSTWIGLSVVTLVLWGLATVLSISLPVVETGSDPTELPMAAFFAPTAATVLTGLAGVVISVFRRGPDRT